MKKFVAMLLALVMALSLVACGEKKGDANTEGDGASAATGKVYYLNFKPEQDQAWQDLAKAYTEETGVPVTVLTAASGTYEEKLTSEIAKTDAPTLFQVNGPVGLASWKDYCYDLKDSQVYGELTSDSFALKDGDAVAGIGYVIESYGLIANKTLLEKAGYTVEDIQSFADLKKVAEDITARKDELGFAAFTSAGMDSSSDWRFKTHLANLPIYFEYQADGINSTDAIKGTYLDNYKNIFDLYINNSTCAPADLSGKTGDDSRNEFLAGQAVFFQNGSWEYGNLSGTFTDDELAMIPIYIGVGDEAKQGLCTGTENFFCINKEASAEDQAASIAFVEWLFSSETGKATVTNDLGFIAPFNTFSDDEKPTDPLAQEVLRYMADSSKTSVAWNFTSFPSQQFKDDFGAALLEYASGSVDWDAVKTTVVERWAAEKAATAAN